MYVSPNWRMWDKSQVEYRPAGSLEAFDSISAGAVVSVSIDLDLDLDFVSSFEFVDGIGGVRVGCHCHCHCRCHCHCCTLCAIFAGDGNELVPGTVRTVPGNSDSCSRSMAHLATCTGNLQYRTFDLRDEMVLFPATNYST